MRAIAAQLDVSKSTAQRLVAEAIAEIKREPAQQVVDMELQRLDVMLLGVWKGAATGDTKAIAAALKIMERRAKYQGLDLTVEPDNSGESREALDELMSAIRASSFDMTAIAQSAVAPGATQMSAGIGDVVPET